ncbi:MAG: gas vesicle protein [Micromonosporaceae bacterium]
MTEPQVYQVRQPGESLVDLLDRVVDRGAAVSGDVIISLAGIDLIRIDLRLLLISVDTMLHPKPRDPRPRDPEPRGGLPDG